jgi:hypothetical protein
MNGGRIQGKMAEGDAWGIMVEMDSRGCSLHPLLAIMAVDSGEGRTSFQFTVCITQI